MIDLWIKALVRFPANIGCAQNYLSNKQSSARPPTSARPLVLDLRTPQLLFDAGRHLTCLAQNASLAGSQTILRCSRLLLAEISRKQFGKALLSDPNVTWLPTGAAIPAESLVLYDGANKPADVAENSVALQMMLGRDVVSDTSVMPYPMHPTTLAMLAQFDLESLRASDRQVELMFAGTQTPRYSHPRIEQGFGVQSRTALLETVRQHRSDRVFASLTEAVDEDSILLVDSQTHGIDPDDWLPTLAKTDFFLCCPGAAQPMCHNVIEAMSVGAIPLIEYGDRFTPSLRDGVNAILFRGLSELKDALDRIDRLTRQERNVLRRNVVEYYENHLRGDCFLACLRDGTTAPISGMISMPFNDKNLFPSRASGSVTRVA